MSTKLTAIREALTLAALMIEAMDKINEKHPGLADETMSELLGLPIDAAQKDVSAAIEKHPAARGDLEALDNLAAAFEQIKQLAQYAQIPRARVVALCDRALS